ncbi:hypothetical protein G7066_01940 [Leucobacter coleopterorum]|uniref:Uncharacterized protein n=1 Tax=Leucobacter coleopterorum TaxID=2714933 RepID=A0ABX6JU09_9MICO|nr:hypothetical protein [Leucobacter coleopterorum]QIM17766.1 hypothetical protein G7066_01940 [Leucobacter coleopterorum]
MWDRTRIHFERIPSAPTDRALYRFERSLPEFVWNAAALEGNTFTLPQVQILLDGVSVGGKRIEEADQILALRAGIQFMMLRVREGAFELNKAVTDQVHSLVARHEAIASGVFRGEGVVDGDDPGPSRTSALQRDRSSILTAINAQPAS